MGFEVPDEVYTLRADDGPYAGAEAKVAGLAAGQMADLVALTTGDLAESAGELFAMFAKNLHEWNLERSGEPIPATLDGVRSLSWGMFEVFLDLWMDAVGGISGPLGSTSPGGGPPVEGSLPMEALSANPPTSSGST